MHLGTSRAWLGARLYLPARRWFRTWSDIMPLLVAEFVLWLGFGAILPLMPLYVRQHGVGLQELGIIVAAWPVGRLVGEPVGGWLGDRAPRIPLMVFGSAAAGLFQLLALILVAALPFAILRALQGFATALYDPCARAFIGDRPSPERRGEAFGLYSAAQMAGLLIGPLIGATGSAAAGGIGFVWVFGAASSILAALVVAVLLRRQPGDRPDQPAARAPDDVRERVWTTGTGSELRVRLLVAAILLNIAGSFAGGTYEVVWSVFLSGLGAGIELIALSFATFGLPILFLAPVFGRQIDSGRLPLFLVVGALMPAVTAVLYTLMSDPLQAIPLTLVEATAFAMLNPALYALVAASSRVGRSASVQGAYGGAGTLGVIAASLIAGRVADMDIRVPFYLVAIVVLACLGVALSVGGRQLRALPAGAGRLQVPSSR